MDIVYRRAAAADTAAIIEFVDYWLAGRGRMDHAPGVVNDYFVSHKQHIDYLRRYKVLLALERDKVVGWAVKNQHNVMIHILIGGDHRGQGIGGEMLRRLNPEVVRSKIDQSTGDPAAFYLKHGYVKLPGERLGRRHNIELFIKAECDGGGVVYSDL